MAQLVYSLDLRDPARRQIRVSLTLDASDLGCVDRPAELFLPAWTPGSYLIREYARHLNDLRAHRDGAAIPVRKIAKNRFQLPAIGEGPLTIEYAVYAHELTVRTCDLTDRHAFLSGAAVFLWPVELRGDQQVRIQVAVPPSWQVHSQLATTRTGDGAFELRACNLDELVDGALLAGACEVRSFEAFGKPHQLILDGLEGITPRDALVADTQAIVERAAAVFGGDPPYPDYKFLCMFTDSGRGGLEHLASSALLAPRTTFERAEDYRELLGLIAHEYFHVWNVKRMRPAELWEFDYENENYTELLWVAEGFTAYYDDHLCRRAGVLESTAYLDILARGITELRRTPGRWHQSLAEASFDAWIRLYRPDEQSRNSTLSYYGNGALAALCLDLRIRAGTGGAHSLDDAVAALYERTFRAGRGYTHEDVVQCLSDAAGSDLGEFVHQLVRTPLDPDFDGLLEPFGLRLEHKPGKPAPHLGVHFKPGTTALSSVVEDSPADQAGLMPHDEILALDELRVEATTWGAVFDHIAACDRPLEVLVARRGRVLTVEAVPTARDQDLTLVPVADPTPEQTALRRAWLFED